MILVIAKAKAWNDGEIVSALEDASRTYAIERTKHFVETAKAEARKETAEKILGEVMEIEKYLLRGMFIDGDKENDPVEVGDPVGALESVLQDVEELRLKYLGTKE